MNRDAIEQLIRRTRRKLFFARWLTATMSFYFYTFFVLTAFILTDRIGGELNLWVPFTLEWIIVSGVIGTVAGGALYGLVHAWWNRCSKREIAWMIDRRCGADALLVTALDSDQLQIDDSWASLMEEKAAELTTSFMSRNLFRIPGQGIRWLFLFALLIDLGLVLLLTPVQKIRTPAPSTGEQARATGGGEGKAKGKTGGGSETKGGDAEQKNEPEASGEKDNSKENSKDESRDNNEENPPMFGEKRRREHERDPQVQEENPESGPTREGFVRAVTPGTAEQENVSGSDDENQDNPDDTPDPSRAEALHRQYQRQAERMIWRRSLSEEERALVRRYFERIRPDSDESTATGNEDTPD